MAEFRLDCMGEICPVPLMKTKKKLASISSGDTLIVYIDHSCAIKNIPEFVKGLGHKFKIDELGDGEWKVTIKKMK